jgi:hypothetical protein
VLLPYGCGQFRQRAATGTRGQIIDADGSVGESGFLQVKIQCWPRSNKRVQQTIETEVELFP